MGLSVRPRAVSVINATNGDLDARVKRVGVVSGAIPSFVPNRADTTAAAHAKPGAAPLQTRPRSRRRNIRLRDRHIGHAAKNSGRTTPGSWRHFPPRKCPLTGARIGVKQTRPPRSASVPYIHPSPPRRRPLARLLRFNCGDNSKPSSATGRPHSRCKCVTSERACAGQSFQNKIAWRRLRRLK